MNRYVYLALAVLLYLAGEHYLFAQSSEPFDTFWKAQPSGVLPFGSGDTMLVLQNGHFVTIPAVNLARAPSTIALRCPVPGAPATMGQSFYCLDTSNPSAPIVVLYLGSPDGHFYKTSSFPVTQN